MVCQGGPSHLIQVVALLQRALALILVARMKDALESAAEALEGARRNHSCDMGYNGSARDRPLGFAPSFSANKSSMRAFCAWCCW